MGRMNCCDVNRPPVSRRGRWEGRHEQMAAVRPGCHGVNERLGNKGFFVLPGVERQGKVPKPFWCDGELSERLAQPPKHCTRARTVHLSPEVQVLEGKGGFGRSLKARVEEDRT